MSVYECILNIRVWDTRFVKLCKIRLNVHSFNIVNAALSDVILESVNNLGWALLGRARLLSCAIQC